MSYLIGLDIGGTKIAGAVLDAGGNSLAHNTVPTPKDDYGALVAACGGLIDEFDKACGQKALIGVGTAGVIDRTKGSVLAPNIPCLKDRPFQQDLEKNAGRPARLGNDADCAALAEAIDGAGQGHRSVFGLIMGTGVGGGFILDGKIHEGAHGLAGEIGHLPLPFREPTDGPMVDCGCGQKGCIDKSASGPALSRLYMAVSGKEATASLINERAHAGDADARYTLDHFYTCVAKAMVAVIHTFDPEIIVVSGGLNKLVDLYTEVPKRWNRYAMRSLRTKFVPAKHGPTSGVRGAAFLSR